MTRGAPAAGVPAPARGPLRPLRAAELAAYRRDGAAVVRGVIPPEWVALVRDAVARLVAAPGPAVLDFTGDGGPRFLSLAFAWTVDDAFAAWALRGPAVEIAGQVLGGSGGVTLFYDQVFAKDPGATTPAPWHQDFPYHPLDGARQVRIWAPLDVVTADSGAVRYLRGSHRWGRVFRPTGFRDTALYSGLDDGYEELPDVESEHPGDDDWLVAEADPGDVVLHHPLTVHGSPGNTSARPRRAITAFYVGDGVTWNPRRRTMFDNPRLTGHVRMPDLAPGGPITCGLFPQVRR